MKEVHNYLRGQIFCNPSKVWMAEPRLGPGDKSGVRLWLGNLPQRLKIESPLRSNLRKCRLGTDNQCVKLRTTTTTVLLSKPTTDFSVKLGKRTQKLSESDVFPYLPEDHLPGKQTYGHLCMGD